MLLISNTLIKTFSSYRLNQKIELLLLDLSKVLLWSWEIKLILWAISYLFSFFFKLICRIMKNYLFMECRVMFVHVHIVNYLHQGNLSIISSIYHFLMVKTFKFFFQSYEICSSLLSIVTSLCKSTPEFLSPVTL
jgi:hypothetical protein